MTIKEKTNALIKAGATITVHPPGFGFQGLEMVLAAVQWKTRPKRFRWCGVFPEDQHHVHETEYDRAEVVHDRDVAFYTGNAPPPVPNPYNLSPGVMVAYICPIAEGGLDIGGATEAWTEWKNAMALPHNKKEFEYFFAEA